jgi:hypothetical protein
VSSIPDGEFSGPQWGPVRNMLRRLNVALATINRLPVVDTAADLPNAAQFQGAKYLVRDIDGSGTPGEATALDGAWYDQNWSAL